MTLTYVYGIVRSLRRPALTRVPPPVPGGGAVQALPAGDAVWLIVSHVPAAQYSEQEVARGLQDLEWLGRLAMAHEAVVEHFLRAPAVLPMQLCTLFTSDERAVAHVSGDRRRIERVLTRVERHVEWGVRVSLEGRTSPPPHAVARRSGGRLRAVPESGAAYLTRKRETLASDRARLGRARIEGDRLYRAMARLATASRRMTATEQAAASSRLLVDAAFLVPVAEVSRFRAAVRKKSRELGTVGLAVTATGPWPPYNFIASAPRRRG